MGELWNHFDINEKIVTNLKEHLKFEAPTKIQEKVLTYVNSKVDLVIQARTGEGKTLAYGIPIVNYILNFYERAENKIRKISPVALILVPTRELGMQVSQHISAILKDLNRISINDKDEQILQNNSKKPKKHRNYYDITIANVFGGFAKAKQLKVLNKYKPEIIIATPGRLWEIIENEESSFLNKLFKLRFLVIDEADRMTEKGHFKELKNIVDYVYTKQETVDLSKAIREEEEEASNEIKEKKIKNKIKNLMHLDDENEGGDDTTTDENKKIKNALKKRGINIDYNKIEEIDPLEMFEDEENIIDDINVNEDNLEGDNVEEEIDENLQEENIDETYEEELNEEENLNEAKNEDDENIDENDNSNDEENVLNFDELKKNKKDSERFTKVIKPKQQAHLRTILCSATLEQIHKSEEKDKKVKNKKNKDISKQLNTESGDIINMQNLMKNIKFYNKLIYVGINYNTKSDNSSKDHSNSITESNVLPEKLELDCYKCEAVFKDYYLFHILKENENKSIIVFTNSISHTKKLFSIFSYFDFKLNCLHSKMQQKQRIKNLERFKTKQKNILFCTDVGARGLDIPLVDLVIHYHIPKTTEMFIHRSGRTARASQEGKCTSLISESELKLYKKIMKDLKFKEFAMKTLNVGQLEKYKSLFEYTKRVEKDEHSIKKQNREKQWFQKKANECEMIFDEEDDGNENLIEEKFLNKKRKMIQKGNIKNKKVFHKINTYNIKRTSFITPELAAKLNNLINESSIKDINLTKAIFDANSDAESFRNKGKQRKKRYIRRKKNK